MEKTYNGIEDTRDERIRPLDEVASEFLEGYRLRNERSVTYAEYAVKHPVRLLGKMMTGELERRDCHRLPVPTVERTRRAKNDQRRNRHSTSHVG